MSAKSVAAAKSPYAHRPRRWGKGSLGRILKVHDGSGSSSSRQLQSFLSSHGSESLRHSARTTSAASLPEGASDTFHLIDLFSSTAERWRRDRARQGCCAALWRRFDTPVFLILLGTCCALISFATMKGTEFFIYYRGYYLPKFNATDPSTYHASEWQKHGSNNLTTYPLSTDTSQDFGLGWLLFAVSCLSLGSFAVIFVHCVGPLSVGSGIAEVKSILSGVMFHRFLGFRTMVAKVVGLICAESAGFSIGKEGPFVHIACCIATLLMRLGIFSRLRNIGERRLELLGAACAVGVAGSFGSTFGGVLFSIEVTTTHYMVQRLPQATFAAICAALFIKAIGWGEEYELFSTHFNDKKQHSFAFYAIFVFLGVACGLLGAFFNALVQLLLRIRKRLAPDNHLRLGKLGGLLMLRNQLFVVWCLIAAYVAAVAITDIPVLRLSNTEFVKGLFASFSRQDDDAFDTLVLWPYLPCKFIYTAMCVVMPIPSGIFSPVFALGGILGRCIGVAIESCGMPLLMGQYEPGEIAVVCAAGFAAGVTRTMSTAVIVMELTGQLHLQLPTTIAVVCAYYAGKQFTLPIYDIYVRDKRIPFLLPLPRYDKLTPASRIMMPLSEGGDQDWLESSSTHADGTLFLSRSDAHIIPIVESDQNPMLLGTIHRSSLEKAIESCEEVQSSTEKHDRGTTPMMRTKASLASMLRNFVTPPRKRTHHLLSNDRFRYISEYDNEGGSDKFADSINTNLEDGLLSPSGHDGDLMDLPLWFESDDEHGADEAVYEESHPLSKAKAALFKRSAPFRGARAISVDPAPLTVSPQMPLSMVHTLFQMLQLSSVIVIESGQVVGVITRLNLMDHIAKERIEVGH